MPSNAFAAGSRTASGTRPPAILARLLLVALVGWVHPATAQLIGDQALSRELSLKLGEQLVLDANGVKSFSEGIKGIIDVRLTNDNTQFVVVGQRPGKTSLLFIMLNGGRINHEVTVEDPNPKIEQPKGGVQVRDNIRLDFYFVQMSTNYSHSLGIGWPASVGAGAGFSMGADLMAGSITNASLVVDQVLPRLDIGQTAGWAKLQRKTSVITANGTQADYSGGGEVNVPIAGGFGGSIQKISYGTNIGVLPFYDRETGRIELQISADVSDLASDNGTGVPGRTTSVLKTVVNLELGQSIVLAGLSAMSEAGSHAGLPLLSQIPILGGLFGSHNKQISETENVVFIVPTVIDTVSTSNRSHITEALRSYEEFSGDFDDVKRPTQFLRGGLRGKP